MVKITLLLQKQKTINTFLESLEKGQFLPNIHRGGAQEISLIREAVSKQKTQVRIFNIIFAM